MSDKSLIEWTDATWNPITGCTVVSPGCTNCYAMKLAGTRLRHHPTRAGLTIQSKAGPVWNGEVRFNERQLLEPLGWKRARTIFVCAHGDLFHPSVPDAWIDRVFAVMALCPQHTFQVLTKRPERMRDYVGELRDGRRVYELACDMVLEGQRRVVLIAPGIPDPGLRPDWPRIHLGQWPLSNLWLGTSVEDQKRADERIPHLLATSAAVRFLSAEPLLGPVDLVDVDLLPMLLRGRERHEYDPKCTFNALTGETNVHPVHGVEDPFAKGLDWVIVGGESGPGARPMHPDWARTLRDQCTAAGLPFFFKQWGNWLHQPERAHFKDLESDPWQRVSSDREGVRPALMFNIGKKAAGRLLDGVEHNGVPAR